jgi:putative tricarboxylic transport membrane protein
VNNIRITGCVFLLVFLGYGLQTQEILLDFWAVEEIFTARTFPEIIALGGVFFSLLLIVAPGSSVARIDWQDLNLTPVLLLLVLLVVFSLSIEHLGFLISGVLMLALGFVILGERRPLPVVAVSVPVVLGLYLLLTALDIHLDPGLLRQLL